MGAARTSRGDPGARRGDALRGTPRARDSVWRNMTVLSARTEVCGEEGARAGSHGEIRNVYWYVRALADVFVGEKGSSSRTRSAVFVVVTLRDARPVRSMSGAAPVPPPQISAGMTAKNLADTVARVAQASSRAARPAPARLVAVSKTKPVPQLHGCYDAGHRDFGENYVQEIVEKAAVMPADVRWRFIGHVQSNKAKALVKGVPGLVAVESVDSVKLANKLDAAVRESAEARMKAFSTTTNPPLGVMVQVNTSGEESKFGVEPESALALAEHILQSCGSLRLEGLMTIGMKDYTSTPENFDALKKCRDDVRAGLVDLDPNSELKLELSMGMSGDFEAAIEMGSDNVRVGSSIFGAREYMYSVAPEK